MPAKKKVKKTPAQLVKGMKDILPDEQAYWEFLRNKVKHFANSYSFLRIDTPVVENTALFKRTVGENTDIVTKEMYSFVSEGGDKLSLRPENTAGVARAYVEHGMLNLPQPVKMYYLGPQFRHDKPQAGRYRQFWQFGFESIGDDDPVLDAQMVAISHFLVKECGIESQVQINSIGDEECRPNYVKELKSYFSGHKKDLCKDCTDRLTKNPLRLLDCKNKSCQDISENAPQMTDHLCDPCKEHFMQVLEYLDEMGVEYILNHRIVRGLDYYNRTAWEITTAGEEGKLNALGGGGRYDDLVEMVGGREKTPAVGFAMGMERIILKMHEAKTEVPKVGQCEIYIAQLGVEPRKQALKLFNELREAGLSISENMSKKGLKDQMEIANKKGASYTLILGQKEISDGTVLIRDMESGVQEIIDYKKVVREIRKRLDAKNAAQTKVV